MLSTETKPIEIESGAADRQGNAVQRGVLFARVLGAEDWLVVFVVVFQEVSWQLRGGGIALTFWRGTGVRPPILDTLAQPVPMPTGGIPSHSGCREWLEVVWRWGRGRE